MPKIDVTGLDDEALEEQFQKTWHEAQGYAEKMRSEPAKKADHLESFNAVYDLFKALKLEKQGRESLAAFDKEHAELSATPAQPALPVKGGVPAAGGPMPHRFGGSRGVKLAKTAEQSQLHREAFGAYLRGDHFAMREIGQKLGDLIFGKEKFALMEADDIKGGFLVPDDFRAEFLKDLAVQATFRLAGARVVPTTKQQVVWPSIKSPSDDRYSSAVAGSWKREGETGITGGAPATQDQPTFGQERIPIHIWQPDVVVVTQEFLDDSAIPVDSVLAELLAEVRSLDEDSAFTNGDGVIKPMGVLSDPDISTVNSGAAAALKYAGILSLWSTLRAPYRQTARWMMNSKTYAEILKLESTGGFLLFPPNSLPGTLVQKEVVFNEFMPDVAANAEPIVFGAFQNYVIAERVDFRLARLTERFWPNVAIGATARVGGKAVRPRAFKKQKVAA